MGPKDDCLLASLRCRLDPFCDTTSTLFSPNLTVTVSYDFCKNDGRTPTLGPKIMQRSKTSVEPATVELREYSIRVCSLGSQSELCARYGDFK